MNVRDLACWPPRWRRASSPSGEVTPGERGVLIAARWDHKAGSLSLFMEEGGDRQVAVLEDKVQVLTALALLLGWHVGRPIAKIGGLELTV
jgi:hypothetical protein